MRVQRAWDQVPQSWGSSVKVQRAWDHVPQREGPEDIGFSRDQAPQSWGLGTRFPRVWPDDVGPGSVELGQQSGGQRTWEQVLRS